MATRRHEEPDSKIIRCNLFHNGSSFEKIEFSDGGKKKLTSLGELADEKTPYVYAYLEFWSH